MWAESSGETVLEGVGYSRREVRAWVTGGLFQEEAWG